MIRPAAAPPRSTSHTLVLALATLAACSGGGGSTGDSRAGGPFVVVNNEPVNGATVYLNDAIAVDFSEPVELDSADLTTMAFQAFDQNGNALSEPVTGTFLIDTAPGDEQEGRRLLFAPRLADNNDYTNGGFRSGRTYLVQLVGGTSYNGTVLRSRTRHALERPATFSFTTRDGTQAAQLFRNPKSGGPRRTGFEVSTATDLQDVPLGLFGAPPLEIRLFFDQALNPNDGNVPVGFDVDPVERDVADRGRVWLEYRDPEFDIDPDSYTWIPADVELERNDLTGATLVLRPAGVLPSNAEIRVVVEPTLEDIAGESNQNNPAYQRLFATFHTTAGFAQQWNGIAEDFIDSAQIDAGAVFPESLAHVGPGYVRAGFDFDGTFTSFEYEPIANEIVLNTGFTQIVPKSGLPFSVTGGVFNFRNVTIPQGVTVTGQGPNPMVWLCSGNFTVAGTLTVRGGNGARVDTLNSANVAKAGGIAHCGGGNGGDGTPSPTQRDFEGGRGRGPLQAANKGGRGGRFSCPFTCYTDTNDYQGSGGGSGGGGGTMATQGDPWWRGSNLDGINPNQQPSANTRFQQVHGYGGSGCSGTSGNRTQFLAGGEPGDALFLDGRADNNFWGSAIDLDRNLRITGELAMPMGGGGGGGGGDTKPRTAPPGCGVSNGDPTSDFSGGGGGAGGGVLIVKALGTITVTSTGHIIADGGNGGGGESAGSCAEGGGGGGGAGGMVVLMSAKRIVIEAHGNPNVGTNGRYCYGGPDTEPVTGKPFLGRDYDFAISADGGVCTTGTFWSTEIAGKYPANGAQMLQGTAYDAEPTGGLGGMGIVQLMVPPGDNLLDGTNTRLDDNIVFRLPGSGTDLTGDAKRQLLAWRGIPDAGGVYRDDFHGTPDIGSDEGDIRPAPILLPVPFSGKSRARSKWIDTGASQRRLLTAPDADPRALVGGEVGPRYHFAGVRTDDITPQNPDGVKSGYVAYDSQSQSVRIDYPVVAEVGTPRIVAIDANAQYLGRPAYRVQLDAAVFATADRYVQYQAELLTENGQYLIGFRILAHDEDSLLLAPGLDLLPANAARLRVTEKFFAVTTNGVESLGPAVNLGTPSDVDWTPVANVRIGFALHYDPRSGDPELRYPTDENMFLRSFDDPGLAQWLVDHEALGRPTFVQWDVLFDMAYADQPLQPSTPRPQLDFLRLPFRF